MNKEWLRASAVRIIKTFAETALSLLTVGKTFAEIDWIGIISISGVSAVICALTCIAGLPEAPRVRND